MWAACMKYAPRDAARPGWALPVALASSEAWREPSLGDTDSHPVEGGESYPSPPAPRDRAGECRGTTGDSGEYEPR